MKAKQVLYASNRLFVLKKHYLGEEIGKSFNYCHRSQIRVLDGVPETFSERRGVGTRNVLQLLMWIHKNGLENEVIRYDCDCAQVRE